MAKKPSRQNTIVKRYQHLRQDQSIVYPISIAFVISIVCIVYLFFMAGFLPSEVPLFYSLSRGVQRLAPATMLILLPASALGILVVNSIIVFFLHTAEPVISRMLAISVGFIAILNAYALVRIVLLVT